MFQNIVRLCAGDFLAKALNFLTFVYLARMLGVADYGMLEFAGATTAYFLLLADGGLEVWAVREAAQGRDVRELAARLVPLRCALAALSFGVLLALLPAFPGYPGLRMILVLFGLTLFAQAISLKWVFLGREQMSWVAVGLVVAQVVFTLAIFGLVRGPQAVVWVPVLRLVGDLALAGFFGRLYVSAYGRLRLRWSPAGLGGTLRPAFALGAANGLALLSYNFDALLLGFLRGREEVGWYSAAYKPVVVALALPLTSFVVLFPALSRTFKEDQRAFFGLVTRSLRLLSVLAMPVGVGGAFLAGPIIGTLFGSQYDRSVPVLQVLCWSAVLVMLRGTYRRALGAGGAQRLDLWCAATATLCNVALNLVLIPWYGMIGAAAATLVSEGLWLAMVCYCFHRWIGPVSLPRLLLQPGIAMLAMGICLALLEHQPFPWPAQAFLSVLAYLGTLLVLGEPEVRSWAQACRRRILQQGAA